MAERKAVNKYYPPDWDPRKGSVNKRVGQHPLRDRARKLSQGILVIRFELPYNIWCGGCGNHVGMGVRYNAEKSKVGNYYSTPIYKFRMKCHLCDNYFEIQTDPKNHDYVILSGARRKEQRWDPVANEQVVPEDKATQKKMATDPMYKLEHGSDDQQKGKEKVMSLAQIEESRISMQDDYILNRMARDKFRTEKKLMKEAADADRAILEKASLSIDLVEESEEDRRLAGLMKYSVTASFEEKQKERRKSIEQRPIFNTEDFLLPISLSVSSSLSSTSKEPKSAKLKRHGDLKHKLGQDLRTTFKDPFKVISKKIGKSRSLFSLPVCSRLGIRLNKSYNATSTLPGVLQKKCNSKIDINIKSSQQVGASSENACHFESVKISHDINSRSVPSDAIPTIVNNISEEQDIADSTCTSEAADKSSEPISTRVKKTVLPESLSSATENKSTLIQLKDQLKSSSSDEQDCTMKADDHEQVFARELKSTASSIKISNTSLQTLMCSYTDSDSESSS